MKEAIRKVRVGWKTYYQYEIFVLGDSGVPLPKKRARKLIERWFLTKTETRILFILFWEVSRRGAYNLLIRKHKRLLCAREFNEFQKVADGIIKRWSQELAQTLFND